MVVVVVVFVLTLGLLPLVSVVVVVVIFLLRLLLIILASLRCFGYHTPKKPFSLQFQRILPLSLPKPLSSKSLFC